nr:hypothetical protein [Treponema sp.]
MKNLLKSFFVILTCGLILSCEIGLGASVDTESPVLTITGPETNFIIRDAFAIKGNWSDDGTISSVKVSLRRTDGLPIKNTDDNLYTISYDAQVLTNQGAGLGAGSGTWSATVDPVAEGILDGAYEASVVISDNGGHSISQTCAFTIDNTAPLLILKRPSTKVTETPDAYGQTFSIKGAGSDDSSIDHIDVNIYSDPECTNLLKTITRSNIFSEIDLSIAVFEEGQENDYSTIYGSTSKNNNHGTQNRYCTITAYDKAKRYPIEGERTASDDNGNAINTYYLYEDIYTGILDQYSAIDLYKMFNGSYHYLGENRSLSTSNSIKENLQTKYINKSSFSLNPENNPYFFVNGKEPLTLSGSDFSGDSYNITNGTGVVVEVACGLDEIPLKAESLRPYLLPCDLSGNPSLTDSAENRIYLAAAGSGSKSGSSYKFTVNLGSTNTYEGGKTISVGSTYIFRFEGCDTKGNSIIPRSNAYGFKLVSSGSAPGLTVTSPTSTVSYIKENGSILLSGLVTCQEGCPTITIKKVGTNEIIYSHTFTQSEGTFSNGIITYPFSYTKSFENQSENSQSQYSFVASQERLETTVTKTIIYDKDPPAISVGSLLPIAKKYNRSNLSERENEITNPEDGYLNGKITLKLSVVDDYDTVDTETEGKKPYFEVLETSGNTQSPLSLIVTGDVAAENTATDKHYITKFINGKIEIDTSQIATGSTEKSIYFKFYAWDRAGNYKVYTYPEADENGNLRTYTVNQDTDKPVIRPTNSANLTLTYRSQEGLSGVSSMSAIPVSGQLSLSVIDDDGLASCVISCAPYNSDSDYENRDNLVFDPDSVQNRSDCNNATQFTETYNVPDSAGLYWIKVQISDINTPPVSTETLFLIKVTSAAPNLLSVSALESDANDAAVGKYISRVNGASKTKWKNKLEIESTEKPFTIWRSTEEGAGNASQIGEAVNSNTIYDVVDTSSISTNQTYYYYVKDKNGTPSNVRSISCFVDSQSPATPVITKPDTSYVSKVLSGEAETLAGSVADSEVDSETYPNTSKSGVAKLYYALSTASAAPTESSAWNSIEASDGRWNIPVTLGTGLADEEHPNVFVLSEGVNSISLYEGHYYLYVKTEDQAGNVSSISSKDFYVDQSAPLLDNSFYKVENGDLRAVNGTVYVNCQLPITFYGTYKDEELGVQELTFKVGSTTITPAVSYSTSPITDAASVSSADPTFAAYSSFEDKKTIKSWKVVYTPAVELFGDEDSRENASRKISITGKNEAETKSEISPFSFIYDSTNPELSNLALTTNSSSHNVHKPGEELSYYVNNTKGLFTLSGKSSDSCGIASVKVDIYKYGNYPENINDLSKTPDLTHSFNDTSAYVWAYSGIDISSWGTSARAIITATDSAGNIDREEVNITFDNVNPAGFHQIDSKSKDLYFRVGESDNDDIDSSSQNPVWSDPLDKDVGGKYSENTYGNASTITIRGKINENGSGLKMIYYYVFDKPIYID